MGNGMFASLFDVFDILKDRNLKNGAFKTDCLPIH